MFANIHDHCSSQDWRWRFNAVIPSPFCVLFHDSIIKSLQFGLFNLFDSSEQYDSGLVGNGTAGAGLEVEKTKFVSIALNS